MADAPAPQPRLPRFRPGRLAGLVGSRFVVFVALIIALALLATLVILPLVVPAGAFVRNSSAELGDVPPLAEALPKPAARSVIYAADRKTVLATLFGDENRKVVKLHDMGMRIRRAVIAIEDYRFYEHRGIDYRGIARAVVEDVREGNFRQGGSTLTQQYIKNVLTGNAKTLDRKIREAIYAVQLEKRLGKNDILEAYLNQAYFGEGAYGVAAAAEHYFSKPVNKLSFPEAAALAATIAAPERYRPTNEIENAPRRRLVLDRMLQLGYATQREVDLAKRERPKIRIKKLSARQPYFVEFIKQQLLHDPAYNRSLGPADTSARRKAVFEGGLSIYTTLQPGPQRAAEAAVRNKLAGKAPDGALASVEPDTGKIVAMVSGKNFKDNQVNLAVLGQGGTGYHSGSTFKVFYLVSALEQGLKPSLAFNAPPKMIIHDPNCPEGWEVGNAEPTEGGNFNMYTGVQHSVNTYFAQLMTKVRPRNAVETARQMGIQVAKPDTKAYANNWNICSSVLGTGNISVLDMASAFGVLANDGVRCQPYSITEVRDRDGKMLLAPRKSSCERVVPQGVSRQVVDMLRTVIQGGTGWRANIGRPLAGKTGTAQDYTSAMFTGFTPQLATSVWVGHRSGLVSMRREYNGSRVFGGTFPALIFHDFMLAALNGKRVLNFPPPPEGRPKAPTPTGDKVPNVVGRQLGEARSILTKAGFKVSVTQVDHGAPKDQVVGQSPGGGAKAAKGTTVTLQVSRGGGGGDQGDATVPGVVGQRQNGATATVRRAGFSPRVTYAIAPDNGDVGRVMTQSPGGGSRAARGSAVILVVGRRIGF